MSASTGLLVQDLPTDVDRVLLLAHVLVLRAADGWFKSQEISVLMEELRLPPVSNVSATLGRLRQRGLAARSVRAPGFWSLSPRGRAAAAALLADVDEETFLQQMQAESQGQPGAVFGGVTHPVMPPELAPPRWSAGIARLLNDYPFEQNVFLMTRFPDANGLPDVIDDVIESAREAVASKGLHLHLASHALLDDELFGNVGAYMWACRYGIGLLEDRAGEGLNYNVMTELGAMLITGRRCALLKDATVPGLPVDLAGHVYKPVDFGDAKAVGKVLDAWVVDDLGL